MVDPEQIRNALPPESNYIAQRRLDEEQASRDSGKTSFLMPFAAGIGAIAAGALVLGNKQATGNLIANFLHFLGHPRGIGINVDRAANAGERAVSGSSGVHSLLTSAFNIKTGEIKLGPLDIVDDLAAMVKLGDASRDNVARAMMARGTEYIHGKYANFAQNSSFMPHSLQRVMMSEVLAENSQWEKIIGTSQFATLKRAQALKLIDGNTALDPRIFKNADGLVRDARWSNIWMKNLYKETAIGDRELIRVPRVDFFGQSNVVKSWFGSNQGFAHLGSGEGVTGPRIFAGGNTYAYQEMIDGSVREIPLSTGNKLKLRRVGDRMEGVRAAREDRLQLIPKERKGMIGGLVSWLEAKTGVGTSFANQRSFISKWATGPMRALRGLETGEAVVYRLPEYKQSVIGGFADDYIAHEMPERISSIVKTKTEMRAGARVNFADLPWHKKLGILFGHGGDHVLVTKSAAKAADIAIAKQTDFYFNAGHMFFEEPNGGFKILPSKGGAIKTGLSGSIGRPEFYTAPRSRILKGTTSMGDLANYMITRINSLASETLLGVSFAPAKTLLGNVTRLAAVPMVYGAAKEAIGYADYLSEKFTGFSPIKAVGSVYAGLRVAQQYGRQAFGIQQLMSAAEKNFPGSVDSGLAVIARSVAAPALTFAAIANKLPISRALIGAAAVYAAIGGDKPGQPASELREEYAGERKVPVRKGAGWWLGVQPLEGGEISRYDYSWYHKLQTDYRTKSIYGSRSEYYGYHTNVFGAPMPTPSNMFGLNNLLFPYRQEELNYSSRPYERTGSPLENVPVFGPLLASTIGNFIKPVVHRQVNMADSGVLPPGMTAQSAQSLGIPGMNVTDPNQESRWARIRKQADIATEPLGVYKFVMQFFGVDLGPSTPQVASSDLVGSQSRALHNAGLGGAFGQTELLRRFMLPHYGSTYQTGQGVDRIRNNMPGWVPGRGSQFKSDQDYYIDYSTGDPFVKIEDAEARLPGKGYEALNPLHSGKEGQYDIVDRLLILSDIAPYSHAFSHYAKQVQGMQLEPEWQAKVQRAMEYKKGMTSIENRYPRYVDSLIALNEQEKDSAIYRSARQTYDFITHDILAEIPVIGSKLAPFRSPYEKYRKQYVEGSEFSSWYNPWSDIARPMVYDMAGSNPVTAAMKGGVLGGLATSELYKGFNFFAYSGGKQTMLFSPMAAIGGAVGGAALSAGRILGGAGQNFIPPHITRESDAYEYMDKLNYLKFRSLQVQYQDIGDTASASEAGRLSRKTMVGARTRISLRSTLPRSSDKKYFDYFLNNTAPDSRQEMIEGLPTYMGTALDRAWNGSYNTPDQADQETASYFQNRLIPDYSSLLWHPSVDNSSLRLKMIDGGINGTAFDMHRFGFYEPQEQALQDRLPQLASERTAYIPMPAYSSYKELYQMHGQNIRKSAGSLTSTSFQTAYGARYHYKQKVDSSSQNYHTVAAAF